MVCYAPGTGTLAVIGFAIYVFWHKAILHFFSMAGTAMEITLLLGTGALVAVLLSWTARMIRRRQAQAGACTTCRFRCQEALKARPNVLINRVDRRVTPPAAARRAALTCHPAAPLVSRLLSRRARPAAPLVSRLLSRRARPAAPAAAPALRPASAATRPVAPALRPASAPAHAARSLRPASAPAHAAPSLRPASVPAAPRIPAPAAPRTPAPAFPATVPAREAWPLAPRRAVREPARPVETVPFDGYVLTPDGVDGRPAPAAEVAV